MDYQQPTHPDIVDELLTLLSDRHCRATIEYLRESSEDVASVGDVADELGNAGNGGADRIALRLHHSILPRLADATVVNYDAKTNTVQYRGGSELESLLDGIQRVIR